MRLHARLEADCHQLGITDRGLLLLHKNASLSWFILVPDTEAIALYQMPEEERVAVEKDWNALAAWVHERYECARVNVAAIGNLVPQLHLHIVARHESDPCWPGVVWGQPLPEKVWTDEDITSVREELREKGLLATLS
jgi:diadenosine tetraphosphate (Ap4A) HIT family hydrolase